MNPFDPEWMQPQTTRVTPREPEQTLVTPRNPKWTQAECIKYPNIFVNIPHK